MAKDGECVLKAVSKASLNIFNLLDAGALLDCALVSPRYAFEKLVILFRTLLHKLYQILLRADTTLRQKAGKKETSKKEWEERHTSKARRSTVSCNTGRMEVKVGAKSECKE